MLLYDSQEKFRLLFSSHGSVVLSCVPIAFLNACVAVLLHYVFFTHGEDFVWIKGLQDTWAASTVGVGISFAIVFRTNIAWSRYWEATAEISAMWSKWTDGYTAMVSFSNAEHRKLQQEAQKILPSEDGAYTEDDLERFEKLNESLRQVMHVRYTLTHDFSLLSALACHRLTHGDLLRMRRRSRKDGMRGGPCVVFWLRRVLKNWGELIVPRQQLRWNDGSSAACLPRLHVFELEELEVDVKAQMVRKSKSTRQRLSLSWSASLDSQDAFKVSATDLTWSSDLPVLGRLTHYERIELERPWEVVERYDVVVEEDLEDPETPAENEKKLRAVPDRMAIIQEWILEDMNRLQVLISMPPPIMSRAYAELSQGMLAFSQAVKMADFPFPFPFAQLLEWLLVAYTVVIPLFATVFTGSVVVGPFLSFLATLTYWTLTSISRELENPFADGPNQVPVIDMHERFVDMLRQVYHARRPDNSATTSRRPSCIFQDELSPKIQRMMTPKTVDPDAADAECNGAHGIDSREFRTSHRLSDGELEISGSHGLHSRENLAAQRRSSRHSLVSFDSATIRSGGPQSPKRAPDLIRV